MKVKVNEYFAQNLKTFRMRAKCSQAEFANKLGITQQAVSLWEKGIKSPKLKDLDDIAEALDIPVATLLGLDKD